MKFLNPTAMAAPASRYSHGVEHGLAGRRLLVSGQVGVFPGGQLPGRLEYQLVVAFENLFSVLADAGMEPSDLVKITCFCTVAGGVATFREVRGRLLGDHAPTCTYLEVLGLASPEMLVEIEAEAVVETLTL